MGELLAMREYTKMEYTDLKKVVYMLFSEQWQTAKEDCCETELLGGLLSIIRLVEKQHKLPLHCRRQAFNLLNCGNVTDQSHQHQPVKDGMNTWLMEEIKNS